MDMSVKQSGGAWAEARMYSLEQAGAFFSRSTKWVRRQVNSGELEAFALPNLVISGKSINRFLKARRLCAKSEH